MIIGKPIALTKRNFVGKVMTLPFNMLSAAAKSLQPCPTLCDPRDDSPPGSPVPGILQARTLEWVAMSFSNAWKWKVKMKSLSRVQLLATSWTTAHQALPSMGYSRQEHWSGLPLPSNMLSRFVINFLKRSRCLNFMAAVYIFTDFRAQENKVSHCFHCFPVYLPWSDGTGCHDLCFLNAEF